MVKLCVYVSMELEGIKEVVPLDEDYEYFFTVQCSSCREVHPKTVSFNQKEEHEISGSKGSAHFVWRCGNCKKEHSASFAPSNPSPKSKSKSTSPIPYSSTNGAFEPLISLDCRGLEFTEFHFRGRWAAKAEEGKEFEIDWDELHKENEDRWDDYDDEAGVAVSVSELKSKIGRA
ncbi:hypothetical protein L486_08043 [Kwoniella mangroviensis CBS 10435]|uniref:DUF866 domain-containing protein n=2 Tax=Kwoniella mangrovensis TaxID=463800 RepID=A0A1B9IGH8_9TREE|nr:uncharacterized protein I203_01003 [Kwoniella mangroviensis CBS 8507]OCF54494.1 hypothetical protein L486_08043 [Kwoniella mangroviensis CBS 10435]OCF69150.1 hypothetical protein I203_01003 [Kwoniella mangroviensis CBS 8507]